MTEGRDHRIAGQTGRAAAGAPQGADPRGGRARGRCEALAQLSLSLSMHTSLAREQGSRLPPKESDPPRHTRSLRGHTPTSLRRGGMAPSQCDRRGVSPHAAQGVSFTGSWYKRLHRSRYEQHARPFSNGQPRPHGPRHTRTSGSRPRSPCPHAPRHKSQRAKQKQL